MCHVGDTAFFARAKIPYHQVTWVIQLFCPCKKPVSPHLKHSEVLPLTLHTISNKHTCQKEKCMINRLWYGNFHIIPHINPRPISARGLIWIEGCCGVWYENCHIIISIYSHEQTFISKGIQTQDLVIHSREYWPRRCFSLLYIRGLSGKYFSYFTMKTCIFHTLFRQNYWLLVY